MNHREFLNQLRSLYNIDHHDLPELTNYTWALFRDDPVRYLIRADDIESAAILREVEKRQSKRTLTDV